MNFTVGSHHFQISVAALGGIAICLFIYMHVGSGSTAAFERWLASGKQEVETNHALIQRDRVHAAESASARAAAAKLKDSTARVTRRSDSLFALVATIHDRMPGDVGRIIVEAGQACHDALTLCAQRGDSLARADSIDRFRADSFMSALMATDTTLARGLGVTDCHLIHAGPVKLIRCPSRVTAFKVGLIGGVVVVEGIRILITGKL